MSVHIQAENGQIAKTVLLPGDPRRAKKIAENCMVSPVLHNEIRNMWGYTGTTKDGKNLSTHASGMGQPSLSIVVNELFKFYGVEKIIRVGTFGSYQKDVPCKSIFLPAMATTDSNMNPGIIKAHPSQYLFEKANKAASKLGIKVRTGHLFSSDVFYDLKEYEQDQKKDWEIMAEQGVVGVEMESHALFCLGDYYKKETLTILVASDNLVTREHLSSEERETSIEEMMKIILEII